MKHHREMTRIRITNLVRYFGNGQIRFTQQGLRLFDPAFHDIPMRCQPGRLLEDMRKMVRTHGYGFGNHGQRQVLTHVVVDILRRAPHLIARQLGEGGFNRRTNRGVVSEQMNIMLALPALLVGLLLQAFVLLPLMAWFRRMRARGLASVHPGQSFHLAGGVRGDPRRNDYRSNRFPR